MHVIYVIFWLFVVTLVLVVTVTTTEGFASTDQKQLISSTQQLLRPTASAQTARNVLIQSGQRAAAVKYNQARTAAGSAARTAVGRPTSMYPNYKQKINFKMGKGLETPARGSRLEIMGPETNSINNNNFKLITPLSGDRLARDGKVDITRFYNASNTKLGNIYETDSAKET